MLNALSSNPVGNLRWLEDSRDRTRLSGCFAESLIFQASLVIQCLHCWPAYVKQL
jgi:hypothetical protein